MTFIRKIARHELGRKLVHLASSVIPLGYWLAGRDSGILILGIMTLGLLAAEVLRMTTRWGHRQYERIFGKMTRPEEAHHLTGASYLFLGSLSAAILFPPKVAILAMLFLSLGDSVAALVGQSIGRIRLGAKTLEGAAACFGVCLLVALAGNLPLSVALAGALTATLAELIPWGVLNDNIAIPLFAGGIMTLLLATPV